VTLLSNTFHSVNAALRSLENSSACWLDLNSIIVRLTVPRMGNKNIKNKRFLCTESICEARGSGDACTNPLIMSSGESSIQLSCKHCCSDHSFCQSICQTVGTPAMRKPRRATVGQRRRLFFLGGDGASESDFW